VAREAQLAQNALRKVTAVLDGLSAELDNTLGGPGQQQQLQRILLKLLASGPTATDAPGDPRDRMEGLRRGERTTPTSGGPDRN
jgi:hypothetical protein